MVYATENGADVINLSLGDPAYSPLLDDVVRFALSRGGRGGRRRRQRERGRRSSTRPACRGPSPSPPPGRDGPRRAVLQLRGLASTWRRPGWRSAAPGPEAGYGRPVGHLHGGPPRLRGRGPRPGPPSGGTRRCRSSASSPGPRGTWGPPPDGTRPRATACLQIPSAPGRPAPRPSPSGPPAEHQPVRPALGRGGSSRWRAPPAWSWWWSGGPATARTGGTGGDGPEMAGGGRLGGALADGGPAPRALLAAGHGPGRSADPFAPRGGAAGAGGRPRPRLVRGAGPEGPQVEGPGLLEHRPPVGGTAGADRPADGRVLRLPVPAGPGRSAPRAAPGRAARGLRGADLHRGRPGTGEGQPDGAPRGRGPLPSARRPAAAGRLPDAAALRLRRGRARGWWPPCSTGSRGTYAPAAFFEWPRDGSRAHDLDLVHPLEPPRPGRGTASRS